MQLCELAEALRRGECKKARSKGIWFSVSKGGILNDNHLEGGLE